MLGKKRQLNLAEEEAKTALPLVKGAVERTQGKDKNEDEDMLKIGDKVRLLDTATKMPIADKKTRELIRNHIGQVATIEGLEVAAVTTPFGTAMRVWYKIRWEDRCWLGDVEEKIPLVGIRILERVERGQEEPAKPAEAENTLGMPQSPA